MKEKEEAGGKPESSSRNLRKGEERYEYGLEEKARQKRRPSGPIRNPLMSGVEHRRRKKKSAQKVVAVQQSGDGEGTARLSPARRGGTAETVKVERM